jgi:hypothetical protein
MKYTYSNNLGEEITIENNDILEDILNKPYQDWTEGSGDSAIYCNNEQRLIFFKIKEGIFIMQHPDYLAPKINNNSVEIFKHYVGGQEMLVPSTNLCDKQTALKIIKYYIEENKLSEEFVWVDYFGELP